MDSSGERTRHYFIATIALFGVAVVSATALCIMAFIRVRRQADPARFATPWLKAASILLLLAATMGLAHFSVFLYWAENLHTRRVVGHLGLAVNHLHLLWQLFDFVAQSCILVMLASIAAGAHSISRNGVATWLKLLRWGVMGMAAIAVALGITTYGLRVAMNVPDSLLFGDRDLAMSSNKTAAAASIIIWITSLGVAGMSIFAMGSGHRTVGILLAVANLLNVIGRTWTMAFYIRAGLELRNMPFYTPILQAILGMWTSLGVILVAIFIMAKRAGGVWTVGTYGPHQGYAKDPRPSAGRSSY